MIGQFDFGRDVDARDKPAHDEAVGKGLVLTPNVMAGRGPAIHALSLAKKGEARIEPARDDAVGKLFVLTHSS